MPSTAPAIFGILLRSENPFILACTSPLVVGNFCNCPLTDKVVEQVHGSILITADLESPIINPHER